MEKLIKLVIVKYDDFENKKRKYNEGDKMFLNKKKKRWWNRRKKRKKNWKWWRNWN